MSENTTGLPLFYTRPQPLNAETHGKLALNAENINYGFATNTNSVPLNATEFGRALKFYPIVFVDSNPAAPVAVVGLRDSQNLFVSPEGKWNENTYIPQYVTRYPFIFLENQDQGQFILCVDTASDLVKEDGEHKFFEGTEATDLSKRALDMCTNYQAQFNFTVDFVKALKEHDLLTANQADITLNNGEKMSLSGFQVVDEKKFNELSDAIILDFHRKGYMALIHAHFISMLNWSNLVDSTATQNVTKQ
jgi:hypothetical protein